MSAPELRIDPDSMVVDAGVHFTADLDVATLVVSRQRSLARVLLTDAVRGRAGAAPVGVLATLMDVVASNPALASCTTDWTATQDLSVHRSAWLTDGPVLADARLVRLGKKVIIIGVDLYDGHGLDDLAGAAAILDDGPHHRPSDQPFGQRSGEAIGRTGGDPAHEATAGGGPSAEAATAEAATAGAATAGRRPTRAATGLVTFARIPRGAARGVEGYDPGAWAGEVRHRRLIGTPEGTMYERMGLDVVDPVAGEVRLALTSYVVNSIGTINGGALTVLIEVAAEAAVPGLVATDLQVHFLSQVKVGPARTRTTVLRRAADHAVVAVEVVDAGNDDTILTLATATLERPAS